MYAWVMVKSSLQAQINASSKSHVAFESKANWLSSSASDKRASLSIITHSPTGLSCSYTRLETIYHQLSSFFHSSSKSPFTRKFWSSSSVLAIGISRFVAIDPT